MSVHLDLLIIGAGCAGLSLADQLAKLGKEAPRTVLLEKRSVFENDRTWCFWGDDHTPFAGMARHQWEQCTVQSGPTSQSVLCGRTPYRILSAADFYAHTMQSLSKNNRLELKMGVDFVGHPEYMDGHWHLQTSAGEFISKSIVDTRPAPMAQLTHTLMWQSFLGVEVDCKEAVFHPDTALLMDFCPPDKEAIRFNYLLPLSTSKALIELTCFSSRVYEQDDLLAELKLSVEKYTKGRSFTISRSEYGLIPMGLSADRPVKQTHASYVHVGLSAGAARPATGYAFQRIQGWAALCARSLHRSGLPVAHQPDTFILRKMDKIFLNVLRKFPETGPALFMNLFAKVKSDQLIRFLSDQALPADYLAVIRALPSAPFLKELFKFAKPR